MASLSWSAFDFGSIDIEITGSAKVIDSRMIGWSSEQSVSPVRVSFSPITAPMSPASTSEISSRLLACICSRRATRSFLPLLAL